MASLTGNAINTSYQGLIKTDDNAIIGATEKRVTDGLGNATNMTIGTGGTSFDSGTVDFTGSTVSGLPPATATLGADFAHNLPPMRGTVFGTGDVNWRSNIIASGFSVGSNVDYNNTKANVSIWPLNEGQTITKLLFNVSTAGTTGAGKIGIYELTTDANRQMVLGGLLQDLGTFSTTATGNKEITLSTPFTMPSGQTYGAVGIVIGGDATADNFRILGWTNQVWNGNSAVVSGTTAYRNVAHSLSSWDGTHKDYSSGTYDLQTSYTTWAFVN